MFPDLQQKIDEERRSRNPKVITLLGMLSKAEKAYYSGDESRAQYIVSQAMKI